MALAVNPGDPITAGLWNALVASVDGKPNGNFGVDTSGSSSNYAVTLDPAPSAYFSGLGVVFVTQAACAGGGVTLNLNGLGPVPIKKQGSLDLEAGDLGASQAAEVCYDGSVFQLLSCASLTTAVGDLVAGGSGGVTARVPGNTSTTKAFLTQTGDGTASASPAWGPIAAADVPTLDAIRQPLADVSLNSQHITSLSDPVNAQDAATKSWVQSVVPQAFPPGFQFDVARFDIDPNAVDEAAFDSARFDFSRFDYTTATTVPGPAYDAMDRMTGVMDAAGVLWAHRDRPALGWVARDLMTRRMLSPAFCSASRSS